MANKSRRKKKRKKPSPQELEQRAYRREIREIFRNTGFEKILGVSDKEIEFKGRRGDFDDVFLYENVLIFTEYTLTASSNISTHLLKKKVLFDHINSNQAEFIQYFSDKFQTFKDSLNATYDIEDHILIILYCSKNSVSKTHKEQFNYLRFFDYPVIKYFRNIAKVIKYSSRIELLEFLDVPYDKIGENFINTGDNQIRLNGFLLPENFSKFKEGHKLVSFYISPAVLLRTSYILRKQGWRGGNALYQRMIISRKLKSIRKYLLNEKRVFINNIITTLSHQTKILNEQGNTVDFTLINQPTPVTILIPDSYNTIGLIDGQHRVFAYFEGPDGDDEKAIKNLRVKTNLLVTGLIFPDNISPEERLRFEAKLFLEINSNQSNASSELKQAIALILDPYSTESMAKAVIIELDQHGPLEDNFVRHFYDRHKIKTTSIVSFGLKPIVKLSGDDSFYHIWTNIDKEKLKDMDRDVLLQEYIAYCTSEINKFLLAVKKNLTNENWNTPKIHVNGLLSTAFLNGVIICLRLIIKNKQKVFSEAYYKGKLSGLSSFDFKQYKSSQYSSMGNDLYDQFFK